MIVKSFSSMAQKYAAVVGRNQRVRVVFQGSQGMTNGKTVVIPTLPAGTVMTPYEEKVYSGYLDHETGHVRWTDLGIMKTIDPKDTLRQHLFNVIEDVREENENIKMYPGSKPALNALAMEVDSKARDSKAQRLPSEATKALSLVYKELWAKYRDCDTQTIEGWLKDDKDLAPLERILSKFPSLKNATGSLQLADEVAKFLKEKFNEEESLKSGKRGGPSQADSKKGSQGKSEPGEGSESDDGEEDDGSGKQLGTAKELGKALAQALEDSDRGKGFEALLEKIKHNNQSLEDDDQSSRRSKKSTGTEALPPVSLVNDRVMIPWQEEDLETYQRERASLAPEITAVKRMVGIYLQTFANKAWSRGLEEGRLDADVLHTLMIGNSRVYKQLRMRRFMDTALLLLLDLSGSMSSHMVRRTAIVLAEATVGVPNLKLQICGFTTNEKVSTSVYGGCENTRSGLGRIEGVDVPIFKGFDEPYHKAQAKMGAIRVSNLTPLGDAYGYAFEALVTRKEARRVLWVVSDGEPCYSYQDPRHSDAVLMDKVHKKCRRFRVQTVGLGIGRGADLKEYVDGYGHINSTQELPGAVLTGLKEILS